MSPELRDKLDRMNVKQETVVSAYSALLAQVVVGAIILAEIVLAYVAIFGPDQ